jgi:chemotaxis protein CheZ
MSTKNDTTIVETHDDNSLYYSTALEEILIGLGHGDMAMVKQAIKKFGHGAEADHLNDRLTNILQSFHETVWSFREGLDPSSVTMTSTNIPDAARKLEHVLTATNEATHKLFALVEHHEALIAKGDTYLSQLEQSIQQHPDSPSFIKDFAARYRELNAEAREVASEMVMTQEFQDLCGQALKKVLNLVQGIESRMVSLLKQLKIEIPTADQKTQSDSLGQQDDVDDLLKDLGF